MSNALPHPSAVTQPRNAACTYCGPLPDESLVHASDWGDLCEGCARRGYDLAFEAELTR
jgi:hypothetical protein